MRVLFLDDDWERTKRFRSRVPSARLTCSAAECRQALLRATHLEPWDVAFLDHDLGAELVYHPDPDENGTALAKWVAEHRPCVDHFVVHSVNHPAAANMAAILRQSGYKVTVRPFAWQDEPFLTLLGLLTQVEA